MINGLRLMRSTALVLSRYLDHADNTWSAMYDYDPSEGLGSDQLHPRHIAMLSPKLLGWFCVLLTAMDGVGMLPEQQRHLLFVAMGKAGVAIASSHSSGPCTVFGRLCGSP